LVSSAGLYTEKFSTGDRTKLVRFGAPGSEKPGLIDSEGKLRDLSNSVPDLTNRQLSDDALARLRSIDVKALNIVEGEVRFGPPVSAPGKMICVGLNYTDHAKEAGLPIPTEPLLFLKGSSPTGANDAIALLELPRFRGRFSVLVPNSRLLDVHRSYQQCSLPPQVAEALYFPTAEKNRPHGKPQERRSQGYPLRC